MKAIEIRNRLVSISVLTCAICAVGCETTGNSKGLRPIVKADGPQVNVHTRTDARSPVTRYSFDGEVCDIAGGTQRGNAEPTNLSFLWRGDDNRGPLFELVSGTAVVQGTFKRSSFTDKPEIRFPIPWPVIITNWVTLGSEGTTFGVYKGNDRNGNACQYVFLYEKGGPLKIEVTGSSPPTDGKAENDQHRVLEAKNDTVTFVKIYQDTAGRVVISEDQDMKVHGAEASARMAHECVDTAHKAAKFDQNQFPGLIKP